MNRHLPRRPYTQRHFSQGADSAAALLSSEGWKAAAEERFTRVKGTGRFPLEAIRFCLEAAGLEQTEIDAVAHGFSYQEHRELFHSQGDFFSQLFEEVYTERVQRELLEEHFPGLGEKMVSVPHHLAHAASAFVPSGFSEALILVADGMGEVAGTTIAVGTEKGIQVVKEIPASDSLGILYGVVTSFLGFSMGRDEYKVMGLAPYGEPRTYFAKLMELVSLRPDGTFSIPFLSRGEDWKARQTYQGARDILEELFGPAREPESPIRKRDRDLAAGLQAVLQTALLHLLKHFKRETGQTRLCFAGGVALNCTANGVLLRSRTFQKMFVQPASGDDGTALGAAMFVALQQGRLSERWKTSPPYPGPSYSASNLEGTLYQDWDRLYDDTVERLLKGQVVGWFQDAMEFGPRALGNRSILADPGTSEMRDKVNRLIKKREDFRPFAPAVTEEAATTIFDIREADLGCFRSMLFTAQVRPEYRDRLPAVTHVDGSARVQVVGHSDNRKFWELLTRYGRKSGLPVLLNTSFNVRGEPIVCTPSDAFQTFEKAGLDAMVIEDRLFTPSGLETVSS